MSDAAATDARPLDLLTMGRSSIDLYANDMGVPFEDIGSFAAYVGGSPTNIAVGTKRLGLNSTVLTGVGDDKVGDFIETFLQREGIDTRHVVRKPGTRSTAVLLGIEEGRTPLVYYRATAPDVQLGIDDVIAANVASARALEISGTGLAQQPQAAATLFAAEEARRAGTTVFMDLDFRADQWHDPRAFGVMVRAALRNVDVAIGTEEEINAAMLTNPGDLVIRDQQVSAPEVRGDLEANVRALLAIPDGPEVLVVKRGSDGASIHRRGEETGTPVAGYPVEVMNVLGAGDAFASGFIYGRLQGWSWVRSAQLGNACGAIVVTRHGCANDMPSLEEVTSLVEQRGGFAP